MLFTPRGWKKYGTTNLVHVHRGINGTVLRNHDKLCDGPVIDGW